MVYMCVRAGARRAGGWQKNGGARAKNEDFSCVYANFFVPLQPQKLQSQAALTDSVTIGRIMTY